MEKYWRLDFSQKCDLSFAEAKERLRELVTAAVRKRLMADVPLGVFLSGGVDSAIIAATVAKLSAPEKVRLFTIALTMACMTNDAMRKALLTGSAVMAAGMSSILSSHFRRMTSVKFSGCLDILASRLRTPRCCPRCS